MGVLSHVIPKANLSNFVTLGILNGIKGNGFVPHATIESCRNLHFDFPWFLGVNQGFHAVLRDDDS